MMRRTLSLAALLTVFSVSAWAADKPVTTIPASQRVVLVQGGGFALNGPAYSVPLTGVTGLFGWGPDSRLDAGVEPNLTGGYMAGVGATVGATPGDPNSGYSLRVGGGWSGLSAVQAFSVNPVSRIGMADATTAGSDMAVSVSYQRSIASGLSVTGAAEAHRGTSTSLTDPLSGASQLVVGAGLSLHF
jgi:hypothetical protein